MDYDIVILGGGLLGCAAAYELSKYNFNIALIEKEYDIAIEDKLAPCSLSFDGLETKDKIVSELEQEGNIFLIEACKKLKVSCGKIDSILLAFDEKEEDVLVDIKKRADEQKQIALKLTRVEALKQVPNIEKDYKKELIRALLIKSVVKFVPYQLALAYGEIAFDNGVKFKLEEETVGIESIPQGYRVTTNKNKFTCSFVLDTITPKEDFKKSYPTIFRSKGDYEKGLNTVIYEINPQEVDNFVEYKFIDDSKLEEGYLKINGEHYGVFTMAPTLAKRACSKILSKLKRSKKKDFIVKRREIYRFRDLSLEQRKNIIRINPKYGNIICQCKNVTEGEIVEAIRRPLGARTIQGIRKRTGALSGICQGSDCLCKVMNILARETNKGMLDIVNDSKASKILLSRIKEFDSM